VRNLDIMCRKDVKKGHKNDEEAKIAHDDDFDSEVVLLMATTYEGDLMYKDWYLNSRYLNHMTEHKERLTNFNSSKLLKKSTSY